MSKDTLYSMKDDVVGNIEDSSQHWNNNSFTYSNEEFHRRMNRKFSTIPIKWDDITKIIDEERFELLSRSHSQEVVYQAHCVKLKGEWRSVTDYILVRLFQFDRMFDEQSGKYFADKDIVANSFISTRLLLNDFPYNFASDIQHWCLWKLNGILNDEEVVKAKQMILNKLEKEEVSTHCSSSAEGDSVMMIHWKNPIHLKSIPDIDHVHILVRIR